LQVIGINPGDFPFVDITAQRAEKIGARIIENFAGNTYNLLIVMATGIGKTSNGHLQAVFEYSLGISELMANATGVEFSKIRVRKGMATDTESPL